MKRIQPWACVGLATMLCLSALAQSQARRPAGAPARHGKTAEQQVTITIVRWPYT